MSLMESQKYEKIKRNIEPIESKILKDFQLFALKEYGNTIVSQSIKKEKIINEFKRFGFDVRLRPFERSCQDKEQHTHYVVELVK